MPVNPRFHPQKNACVARISPQMDFGPQVSWHRNGGKCVRKQRRCRRDAAAEDPLGQDQAASTAVMPQPRRRYRLFGDRIHPAVPPPYSSASRPSNGGGSSGRCAFITIFSNAISSESVSLVRSIEFCTGRSCSCLAISRGCRYGATVLAISSLRACVMPLSLLRGA